MSVEGNSSVEYESCSSSSSIDIGLVVNELDANIEYSTGGPFHQVQPAPASLGVHERADACSFAETGKLRNDRWLYYRQGLKSDKARYLSELKQHLNTNASLVPILNHKGGFIESNSTNQQPESHREVSFRSVDSKRGEPGREAGQAQRRQMGSAETVCLTDRIAAECDQDEIASEGVVLSESVEGDGRGAARVGSYGGVPIPYQTGRTQPYLILPHEVGEYPEVELEPGMCEYEGRPEHITRVFAAQHTTPADAPAGVLGQVCKPRHLRLMFHDVPLARWEWEELRKMQVLLGGDERSLGRDRFTDTVFENMGYRLRFLQGTNWDTERTLEEMDLHLAWRREWLPVRRASVEPHLNRGWCYVCGRDKNWRPVFVVRVAEICRQGAGGSTGEAAKALASAASASVTAKNDDQDPTARVLRTVLYWLEMGVQKLTISGHVEQWCVIIDMTGVSTLPVSVMKQVAALLIRNYRGRLFKMFVCNVGLLFWGLYKCVRPALPETTKDKIVCLHSNQVKESLAQFIEPDQLEQRFGGTIPDLTKFDEPVFPKRGV